MGNRITGDVITGAARMRSKVFSNQWTLEDEAGRVYAHMRRFPRQRMSQVQLADGTRLEIAPHGWGVHQLIHEGDAIARIERRSWWGRRFEITSPAFGYNLVSRPAPRSWDLAVGEHPVAHLRGSLVSYNRLRIQSDLATPTAAVLLAWQVLCRPWEQGAFPIARPAGDETVGEAVARSGPGRVATRIREEVEEQWEEWLNRGPDMGPGGRDKVPGS